MPIFSLDEVEEEPYTVSSSSTTTGLHDQISITFDKLSVADVEQPFRSAVHGSNNSPFTRRVSLSQSPEINYLNNANKVRRRSSVLRRMSISSIVSENSVAIPIDVYNETDNNDDNSNNNNNVLTEEDEGQKEDEGLVCDYSSIDHYESIKVLGYGAYGKVYLTRHKRSGYLYAQKELKKASITINQKSIERTLSERSILSSISAHPNIVKLFHAFHDKNKLYLMLQYIPGGELFQYLANERFFPQNTVSFYSTQMIMALRHLHELGIVYRDLKPENCLLNERGYLVLTDFGLSKESADSETSSNFCSSIIGTPEYVAPEVLKGEQYGMVADWWSLGAVMFDMLTGAPPFTGNNHKAISDKILKSKVNFPKYMTNEAKDLLNKLLNKNPEKRFNVDEKWQVLTKHMFFRYYDWKKLANGEYDPPIAPILTDISGDDSSNVVDPSKMTSLSINSNPSSGLPTNPENCFDGFTYSATNSFIERYIQ